MTIITHFTPTLSWADASAAFLAAYGAEKLYDDLMWTPAFQAVADDDVRRIPEQVTAENERLTDVRCEAENVWIAALAPDMVGVIMKIEYARRRWEDCEDWPPAWWNAVLADLRRLGGVA